MKQDEYLQALRQVVAEAILLGTTLAEKRYGGLFFDEANRSFWDRMRSLHEHTAALIAASGLTGLSAGHVFPVHDEMQRIADERSAAC
jgi:hypothetical protein